MKLIDKIAAHFGYVPFSDLKDIAEDIGKFDEIAQEAAHRLKSTAALEDFANYVGLVNVSKATTDHYIMFESGWDMDVATPAFASMGLIFMASEPEVIEEDITEKVFSDNADPLNNVKDRRARENTPDVDEIGKYRDPMSAGFINPSLLNNPAIDVEVGDELPYAPGHINPPEHFGANEFFEEGSDGVIRHEPSGGPIEQ